MVNSTANIEKCSNCSEVLVGAYCCNCGHPKQLRRINSSYILSEISNVLNLDKGILYTIRELLVRPGDNIKHFIKEDRNRLVKPIIFIIITSLVYTLAQQWLHFEDGYVGFSNDEKNATKQIFDWISSNYGYSNILMALFIGLWIKLFFRKYDYNFFEILILLCYTMGMGMLIFTLFGAIQSAVDINIFDKASILGILYISWAIGQFFDKKIKMSYLKSFISYILGMFTFSIFAFALGSLIDWMTN